MTREEKILEVEPIIIGGVAYITDLSFKKSISEVFDHFEQRNTELEQQVKELQEPKTCDGCEYRLIVPYEDCTHWSSTQEDCCIRYNHPTDFYKLKQN